MPIKSLFLTLSLLLSFNSFADHIENLSYEEIDQLNTKPIKHTSQGKYRTYVNYHFYLTPNNTILPNDPRSPIKDLTDNYRDDILDETADNFSYGQFRIFIPSNFTSLSAECDFLNVSMPQTLERDDKPEAVIEKQNLYLEIKNMVESQQGYVPVVLEEFSDGYQPCKLFFRVGNSKYVNYVGQYNGEVVNGYTGQHSFTDDNNKQDILYLIYGHDFSHRVMNYKDGKLDGLSTYFDKDLNPVLLEWYEDGVLIEQESGAHEASEKNRNEASAWLYKGKVLPPNTFKKKLPPSDYFEAFEDHFDINCTHVFRSKPGLYFGKAISHLDPIEASWGESISLAVAIDDVDFDQPYHFEETDHGIDVVHLTDGIGIQNGDERYQIMQDIPLDDCDLMAPYINGSCKEAYKVHVSTWNGGSMGHQSKTGIYGLFEMDDGKEYILPLYYVD